MTHYSITDFAKTYIAVEVITNTHWFLIDSRCWWV